MFNELLRKKSIQRIINEQPSGTQETGLRRNLRQRDLVSLAIAAIIGAGIFSTIGNAAFYGGPAVSFLFIFTAIACSFSALCYAEFASRIPLSGSAYTYTYASLGEIFAWIIGWDLIMEYSVGNIAVAISWSDYFTGLMDGLGFHIPAWLSMDYLSASRGYEKAIAELSNGSSLQQLSATLQEAYSAWINAPSIFGIRLIADIPAFSIVALITMLVYTGIKESKIAGNIMVLLKLAVILMVIAVGAFYVKPENWSPFAPNGLSGVLKGVSAVFFAYIGFDAISTTAEECRNPQRDLPRAMIISLLICTLLYVLITLVLTGMVNYSELGVGDPLAFVFQKAGLDWISGIIAVSAIIAMASVLLVFQIGQPRIWMSMSRDGLLPQRFSKIHPRFKTPSFSTLLTGFIVAIPTLFMNLTEVTDLTSIGTLFAFVMVCAGVIVLGNRKDKSEKKTFTITYVNSRFYLPPILIGLLLLLWFFNKDAMLAFFDFQHKDWLHTDALPFLIFVILSLLISVFAVIRKWSLIPVLGLLTNLYLIAELGWTNWIRFIGWLIIGLLIYFLYGRKHSKENTSNQS